MSARPARVDDLAVFGGTPLFASPRPIGQLDVPPLDDFLASVRRILDDGRLSGNGRVVEALERDVAAFHDVRHCIAVANAGLALIMLAQVFAGDRHGEVIMPAFSYRGLPHFAQWAGQMPRFCDVEAGTHALDPRAVAAAIGPQTTSILGVCNFNAPGDLDGLCEVAERFGVPIVFDSVYAVGSTYRSIPLGGFGRAEVYSFHATKLLNGFEGGYVTTNDDDLAAVLRWQRDGARPTARPHALAANARVLGANARLNEIHAALARLALAEFDAIVDGNRRRLAAYREIVATIPGLELLPYPGEPEERRNYELVVADVGEPWPLTRDQTVVLLRAEGAAITAYYSPPLHRSVHAPPGIPIPDLPVSEALAERFIQLPVGALTSLEDIARLGELLAFVTGHGAEIRARLEAGR